MKGKDQMRLSHMNTSRARQLIKVALVTVIIMITEYQLYTLEKNVSDLQSKLEEESRYRRQDTDRLWTGVTDEGGRRRHDVSLIWNHMADEPSRK